MPRLSLIVVLALLLSSSDARVPHRPAPITMEYAAGLEADHYLVPQTPVPAPVAVLVHGCCGDRRDMSELARALARSGAVVVNPDVRAFRHGGGWPTTYDDVVCAVAAGRHFAAQQGRGTPVILIGWSDGALVAAAVTLGWSTLSAQATDCTWPVPASGPDQLVGLSGHYGWPTGTPAPVNDGTIGWFGGSPALVPTHWQLGNPGWWAENALPDDVPPITLLSSATDAPSYTFAAELRARAIDVVSLTCGDTSHEELIHPRGVPGAGALGSLERIIGSQQDRAGCASADERSSVGAE